MTQKNEFTALNYKLGKTMDKNDLAIFEDMTEIEEVKTKIFDPVDGVQLNLDLNEQKINKTVDNFHNLHNKKLENDFFKNEKDLVNPETMEIFNEFDIDIPIVDFNDAEVEAELFNDKDI
jgi:hypothetical protein